MGEKVKLQGIEVPQWYLELEPKLLEAMEACIAAEDKLSEIRSCIYDMMSEEGIDYINSGLTEVTLCKPTTVENIDKERLKNELPDIFKEYTKTYQRKGYAIVKLT